MRLIVGPRFAFAVVLIDGLLRSEKSELRGTLAEGASRLALTYSLDQEIVVTGTRDPSRSIICKMLDVTVSRFRRKICQIEAQWAELKRDSMLAADELARRAREYNEIRTTIVTRTNFPGSQ
jgi:hypothetical protein